MAQTPGWGLTLLDNGQANADITHNSAILGIDALIGIWNVINITTTTPPSSPAPGDAYVCGASSTGAWAGQDGNLAVWSTVDSGWVFFAIRYGTLMYDQSADTLSLWKMDNSWHLVTII